MVHHFYPSQTKILEGRTNVSECIFEALFKGVSTRFGLRIVEKCFEDTFWKVGSAFQNFRLGSIILGKSWKGRFVQNGDELPTAALIILRPTSDSQNLQLVRTPQPSATSPLFSTISPIGASISTNISMWICGWHFCRNARPNGGDCRKKGTSCRLLEHLHCGNVWRTFVRLGRIMIKSGISGSGCYRRSYKNQHIACYLQKFTPPKRRFGKAEQTFQNTFSKHFSRAWVLDLGYKTLKSASKTRSEMFVRSSEIFVWGA